MTVIGAEGKVRSAQQTAVTGKNIPRLDTSSLSESTKQHPMLPSSGVPVVDLKLALGQGSSAGNGEQQRPAARGQSNPWVH